MPEIFLRDQKLFELKRDFSEADRKTHVCGSAFDEKAWAPLNRDTLCGTILGKQPSHRVALVCDAGLGKTTNMEWLQAHLAESDGWQLPVLIRLDTSGGVDLLETELASPIVQPILTWLAQEIFTAGGTGNMTSHLPALQDLQSHGRLTLLIDGLDHAINRPTIKNHLKRLLESVQWRTCPIWISGRPTAFETHWKEIFAAEQWRFTRVVPLAEREIRFYMRQCAGGDWYAEISPLSRSLLTIPRFLRLICGVIRGAISGLTTNEARRAAVRKLKLNTPADVYCLAFLKLGREDDADSQGLLAQGLRGVAERIGLSKGEEPLWNNRGKRVERTAALLGAIAFQMFDPKTKNAVPNFGGVDLNPFQDQVARRIERAELGTAAEFGRDFTLLKDMNIHALDFLLFRESDEERLAFHDRTTQAFFAAYWACRHAKVDDTGNELDVTRRWAVDGLFNENQEFHEFWQFGAEMPDSGLPKNEDGTVAEDRWLALFTLLYDGSVKDTKGRPKRSTEFIYRSWSRMEKSEAGREIIAKKYRAESIAKKMGDGFIPLVGTGLPQDTGTFNMGEEDQNNSVTLAHFCLHQYCVTNVEYERFDPRHQERRWAGTHRAVKELRNESADDDCPVVNVSWYDAWCYAKYLGTFAVGEGEQRAEYEVVLPSEEQWEYVCRAGRNKTRFTFDEAHPGTTCTPEYCNFDGSNYPDEGEQKGEYRECTLPVDGKVPASWNLQVTSVKGQNRWGFYQMHGNVWEWCLDWYDQSASARVLRGGCWLINARYCRSALRRRRGPAYRVQINGFRLAAVPAGAK